MIKQVTLFNILAFITWSLQVAVLLRMKRTGLRREFPMFFAYTAFTFFQGAALFAIRNHYGYRGSVEYFLAYWFLFPIQITLMFFVIQEIYAKVLYRYDGLRTLSSAIFRWAFMLLVVVAIATSLSSPDAARDWMFSGILRVDYSTRIVEFGLIVLLLVFVQTLSLGWQECVFGIAIGTCFYCAAELSLSSLRAHFGASVAEWTTTLQPFEGVVTLGIWTAYFYRAERRTRALTFTHRQLEEWNQAVLQFLNR